MSYKFDKETGILTLNEEQELYVFHVDWVRPQSPGEKQIQKVYPKKLVFAGKGDINSVNLRGMLGEPEFAYTEEIEINEEVKTLKAVDNIVYSKDGKELLVALKSTKKVVVPNGVKVIRYGAFSSSKISEIEFPKSLEMIGDRAFFRCKRLKKIDLSNVKRVRDSAFYECSNLKEVNLGKSLEDVGYGAFAFTKIENIDIPETVARIDDAAFARSKLKEITIPDSLVTIGESAFGTVAKVHAKKYHSDLLIGCLRFSIPQRYEKESFNEVLIIEHNGAEVVVPKCVHLVSLDKMKAKLKNYFLTGSRLLINDMFSFAYDNGRKEYVAFETLKRYDAASICSLATDVDGVSCSPYTSDHFATDGKQKVDSGFPSIDDSEPAVMFLNAMAADTAMRCNTEESLMEMLKMRFWTDESLKKVLDVTEEKGWIQASAYVLNEIGRTGKEDEKLNL